MQRTRRHAPPTLILTNLLTSVGICIVVLLLPLQSSAQTSCLTTDDVTRITADVKKSGPELFNPKLRDELVKLHARATKHFGDALTVGPENTNGLRKFRGENTKHLCRILKSFDWPGKALAGLEGQAAAFFLLKNSSSVELQKALLPLIISLTLRGEIDRPSLAGYVDRLRLSLGMKQLYGTDVTIRDGFLVLSPMESANTIDARRSEFNLSPLAQYLQSLEIRYKMPLVRSPGRRTPQPNSTKPEKPNEASCLLAQVDEANDVIRVDTNLVSVDVSVYSKKLKSHVTNLDQKDFRIFEDGQEETISYFAATPAPFDLILLIDLSGSTDEKRDLIRTSTQHFIEAARPADRVAIVTFADATNVVAPLSSDRSMLLQSIKNIEGTGRSKVWDALKLTLDRVAEPRSAGRRGAVVFMTDGAENRLVGFSRGSRTSFADLLETVRLNGTLIFPIYLDTEGDDALSRRVYKQARQTLRLLAEESGGRYYKAGKIEDLKGVYNQVVGDLAKIYSLGYRPANPNRDGSWRTIQIQIANRTDLVPRARSGYYAK